jgi:phosphoglycolate phosphatase-like HAD superfamily hydrolase
MAARKRTTFPRSRATGRKLSSPFDAQVWVFDVEGTLVDAVMSTLRCWRRTFELFGHDVGLAELHRLSGMDGAEMLKKLLPHVPAIERQEMLQCQGAGCDAVFRDPAALLETLQERAGADAGARPAPAMQPAA